MTDAHLSGRDAIGVGIHRLQRLMASRRVGSRLAEAADVDLPQQAVNVLRALGDGEAMTVADVARAARMDIGAVSRQLAVLEQRRLVRRPSGGNGSALVAATATGRRSAARVEAVQSRHLRDVLSGWTAEERDTFGRLFLRFVDGLAHTPYRADQD
ncbi:MAG: MarR family transcriptional regulator [Actinobacteria bacterium]|nr:MarR family transcriptional regulator [Actinomycetota bacterium]